jgi:hypothetical protein
MREKINEIIDVISDQLPEAMKHHTFTVNVSVPDKDTIFIKLSMSRESDLMEMIMKAITERLGGENIEQSEYGSERMMPFNSLKELMDSLKYMDYLEYENDKVLKADNTYYLYITLNEPEKYDDIMSEFFIDIVSDEREIAHIKEHAELIVENAYKKLSRL